MIKNDRIEELAQMKLNIGEDYFWLEDYRSALEHYQTGFDLINKKNIEHQTLHVRSHLCLGNVKLILGRYKESLVHFELAQSFQLK